MKIVLNVTDITAAESALSAVQSCLFRSDPWYRIEVSRAGYDFIIEQKPSGTIVARQQMRHRTNHQEM